MLLLRNQKKKKEENGSIPQFLLEGLSADGLMHEIIQLMFTKAKTWKHPTIKHFNFDSAPIYAKTEIIGLIVTYNFANLINKAQINYQSTTKYRKKFSPIETRFQC